MSNYVICSGDRRLVTFDGVKMFGKKVEVIALFPKEQDALDILFELQEQCELMDHQVFRIGDDFITAER